MSEIKWVRHGRGAWLLRHRREKLSQLKTLLDEHSFWGRGTSLAEISAMLRGSDVVMSAWSSNQLVGFGRATSDGVFRAVLWDVVVHQTMHRRGIGSKLVMGLLSDPNVACVERVYLMTTEGVRFYEKLGFRQCCTQHLMRIDHQSTAQKSVQNE